MDVSSALRHAGVILARVRYPLQLNVMCEPVALHHISVFLDKQIDSGTGAPDIWDSAVTEVDQMCHNIPDAFVAITSHHVDRG